MSRVREHPQVLVDDTGDRHAEDRLLPRQHAHLDLVAHLDAKEVGELAREQEPLARAAARARKSRSSKAEQLSDRARAR